MRKPQAGKLKKPTECVRVRTAPKGTWKFPYGNFPELKGLNTYLDLLTRYVNDKYWNDESNGKSLKWSYDDLTKKEDVWVWCRKIIKFPCAVRCFIWSLSTSSPGPSLRRFSNWRYIEKRRSPWRRSCKFCICISKSTEEDKFKSGTPHFILSLF